MRPIAERYEDCLTLARATGLDEPALVERFFGPGDRAWRELGLLDIRQAWWAFGDALRAREAPTLIGLQVRVAGSTSAALGRLHREINYWAAALGGAPVHAGRITGADRLAPAERDRLQAHLEDLLPWDEDADPAACDSILAIGPGTRGRAWGQLLYRFDTYDPAAPFDPAATIARGHQTSREEAIHAWAAAALAAGELDETAFASRFGEPLPDPLSQGLAALGALGQVEERGSSRRLKSPSRAERGAALLLLADPERLHAAWRAHGLRGPAWFVRDTRPRQHLVLEAAAARVTVTLTTHEPGFRSLARAGAFACYLPSDLPEATCRHDPLAEALLAAFRRLFSQVVQKEKPDTLDRLARALLARGRRLRLTGRGRFRGVAVRITRGEADG